MSMAEIITPCWLWSSYLRGIRDTDKAGNKLPESFTQIAIDAAIDWLEGRTNLVLTGSHEAEHTERKDSFDWYAETWYLMNLLKRPIATVTEFSVQYGNFTPAVIPTNWLIVRDPMFGKFQLTLGPGSYTLPPFPFPPGLSFGMGRHYDPAWIRVKYIAGFVKALSALATTTEGSSAVTLSPLTGSTSTDVLRDVKSGHYVRIGTDPRLYRVAGVTSTTMRLSEPAFVAQSNVAIIVYGYDPMLLETAAMVAADKIMEIVGTWVLGGPAVAAKSLSIDSMQQHKPYAVAPGRGPYAALQATYRDRVDENLETLARRYAYTQVFAI